MKTFILSASLILFSISIFSQTTSVPDDNFEAFLEANSMGDGIPNNDLVTTSNINTVTSLFVDGLGISDLSGIEGFAALQNLGCSNNSLSSLDLSSNSALTFLNCSTNFLNSLDLTFNINLTTVNCSQNTIANLNVTQCPSLFDLNCRNNQLASVNLTGNGSLGLLNAGYNPFTSMNLTTNTALFNLNLEANSLPSLDLTSNTELTLINIGLTSLTSLDLSQNTKLQTFNCISGNLNILDVSSNLSLTSIDVRGCQLTDLDLSANISLVGILCSNNLLQSLNVKNGNNTSVPNGNFSTLNNSSLACITVDDVSYSNANWSNIDPGTSFSTSCPPLSIEDKMASNIKLYPNPIINEVNIKLNLKGTYKLVSILGKEVKKGDLYRGDNTLDFTHLNHGLYFLNVETYGGVVTKKLIKL